MNEDKKSTGIIIGMASDTAKLVSAWDVLRKLFSDYADAVIAAAIAFDEALNTEQKLEELSKQIKENCIALTGISPKEYGTSLQKHPHKASTHYNYIPRTPRNLPYQRRTY